MRNKIILSKSRFNAVKKALLLLVILFVHSPLFSQTTQAAPAVNSVSYSSPLFILFVLVIIFLLVIIIVLADVVKGSAKLFVDKEKRKIDGKQAFILILLSLGSYAASAQGTITTTAVNYGGMSAGMFYTFIFVLVFEVAIIGVLIYFIRSFLGIREMQQAEALLEVESKVEVPSLIEKLNASVAIEREADILLDHNYDGIQELDNNLPPWWKYGFYLTIVFAVIYLIHYHVIKTGDLQGSEYTKEIAQAAIDVAEYQKKSALSVDENTVKLLVDETSLSKGKEIYVNNCVACHGKFGEGQVGPNLTDNYWIHGGSIQDVFKTIKYGYPDKGMKSWKEDLSPSQISFVAAYLHTLVGTNPANQKEKQGDLFTQEILKDSIAVTSQAIDSTKTLSDTLVVKTP